MLKQATRPKRVSLAEQAVNHFLNRDYYNAAQRHSDMVIVDTEGRVFGYYGGYEYARLWQCPSKQWVLTCRFHYYHTNTYAPVTKRCNLILSRLDIPYRFAVHRIRGIVLMDDADTELLPTVESMLWHFNTKAKELVI